MKKLYLLFPALAFSLLTKAQMLTPTVLASTGGFSENANGSLSFTVGEMTMVRTFTAQGNILTQGFQQPEDKITGLIDLVQGDFGSFVVYPNPAVDDLWFGLQLPESGKVEVKLYDAVGQMIASLMDANYENEKLVEHLNVSMYPSGVYLLSMNFTSGKDGTKHTSTAKFQIVK